MQATIDNKNPTEGDSSMQNTLGYHNMPNAWSLSSLGFFKINGPKPIDPVLESQPYFEYGKTDYAGNKEQHNANRR